MSIVNFDRDLDWINVSNIDLSPAESWVSNPTVSSDGVVYNQEASVNLYLFNNVFPATYQTRSSGIHIIGPDITGGSPYRVKGYINCNSDQYIVRLMWAVSPASISTLSTVEKSLPLITNHSHINIDHTFYIPSLEYLYPGQGYSDRSITFFVMYYRFTGIDTVICDHRLSVQRLSVKPSQYITANR